MKKTSIARIMILVLSLALLIGSVMVVTAMAADEKADGSFDNISVGYGDKVYIRVEVKATKEQIDGGNVVVSYKFADEAETKNATYFSSSNTEGYVWVITEGIAAYDMAREIVFTSAANDVEVEPARSYSVAQFLYKMLYTESTATEAHKDMYKALIEYGRTAQIALEQNTDKMITDSTLVTGAEGITFGGKDFAFAPGAKIEVTPEWANANDTVIGWTIKEGETTKEVGLTFECSGIVEVVAPILGEHVDPVKYDWAEDNSYCKAYIDCDTHYEEEIVYINKVALTVRGTDATYVYAAPFENEKFTEQTLTFNADCTVTDGIATINAPTITDLAPSHDYVKFDVSKADAEYDFVFYFSEVDVWDGTSVSEGLAGAGTAEDPFLIQSAADLAYVAKVTNEANAAATNSFIGQYLKLTKSIDLNNYELHIGTGSNWGNGFAGFFEGNNCTIRNINNKYPLFGGMYSSWVKNLSLYGKVQSDRNYIATLASYTHQTTFHNITNYANVTGTNGVGGIIAVLEQNGRTSEGLVNYGAIVATGWLNGGIIGKIGGNLTNSVNWGSVTANGDSNVGGIAGGSQNNAASWNGTISNCANYGVLNNNGKAVAHIIGGSYSGMAVVDCIYNHTLTKIDAVPVSCETDGNVEYWACSVCKKNLDADGNVIADVVIKATGHAWDEGVVAEGKITFTCQNDASHTKVEDAAYTVTVNHLFLDGTVAAEAEALQITYNQIATINAKAIEGYVASHDYVKVHVLDNATVTIYYSQVDVWDGTSVSDSLAGTGTAEDPFLIQSAADFAYFAGVINAVEGAAGTNYKVTTFKGQYFKMTKSIDLAGNELYVGFHAGWNNYQGFFGTFDGNNCTIRGIAIDNTGEGISTALFGCVNGGTIKNLSIYGTAKGTANVGGLVAYATGVSTIDNITSYVTITQTGTGKNTGTCGGIVANQENSNVNTTIINCVNYGTVNGTSYIIGGIAGSGGATITNCVNWADVTGGDTSIGGIAGSTKAVGTITGCVNYGSVKTTSTSNTHYTGGIVGTAVKPLDNCVNYGTVTGAAANGIAGSTTSTITNCYDYSTEE